MEELEELLKQYNLEHSEDLSLSPWRSQYCRVPFPKYWQRVYQIMNDIDRSNRVIEIGCGQGDVTAIFCYLGFQEVASFEKEQALVTKAKRRINDLFDRKDVIVQGLFPEKDILYIQLVNATHTYKKWIAP